MGIHKSADQERAASHQKIAPCLVLLFTSMKWKGLSFIIQYEEINKIDEVNNKQIILHMHMHMHNTLLQPWGTSAAHVTAEHRWSWARATVAAQADRGRDHRRRVVSCASRAQCKPPRQRLLVQRRCDQHTRVHQGRGQAVVANYSTFQHEPKAAIFDAGMHVCMRV